MSVCCVVQSRGVVATGGTDVTPSALNWTDINAIGSDASTPIGTSNSQTLASIDTPITLRATFTNSGAAAVLTWVKNGVDQSYGTSPQDVSVSVGDTLRLRVKFFLSVDVNLAASGVITVTNSSDGGAAIDTLNYYIERL